MESTKQTISNLKFLGLLRKHDKINTTFMYRQQDGFFTSLSRTFLNYDSRSNGLKFIENTITKVFEILHLYEGSTKLSDKAMCLNIIKDLKQSKVGLCNLKETYSNDLKFICDIDTILESIDTKMKDINHQLAASFLKFQQNDTDNIEDVADIVNSAATIDLLNDEEKEEEYKQIESITTRCDAPAGTPLHKLLNKRNTKTT